MSDTERKMCDPVPEWHEDRVRQAINEYDVEMALAADLRRIAKLRNDEPTASVLRQYADDARQRAHDAVLEAAEAVKQERGL